MVDTDIACAQYIQPPMYKNEVTFFGPTLTQVAEDTVKNHPYVVLGNVIYAYVQLVLSIKYPHFMQSALGVTANFILTIVGILISVYFVSTERTRILITRIREPKK